ncbi:MAG: mercury resistance system transport protein MerF [Rhodothermales bacterium]
MKKYTKNKLVLFGGIGTAIVALCCFTPVLVIALTALGAAAVFAYLDYVLLPLLLVFAAIAFVGVQQVRRSRNP